MINFHQNLKLIEIVSNSPKTVQAAVEYMTSIGIPKITTSNLTEIISEISHLSEAGQHVLVLSNHLDSRGIQLLKHNFPGKVHEFTVNDSENIVQQAKEFLSSIK